MGRIVRMGSAELRPGAHFQQVTPCSSGKRHLGRGSQAARGSGCRSVDLNLAVSELRTCAVNQPMETVGNHPLEPRWTTGGLRLLRLRRL